MLVTSATKTLMKPTIARVSQRERDLVHEVLETEFRSSRGGMMTARLERAFVERFGVKYAISFVNGTATMHAALVAAGVGPGDEVIVPPLTMSSTTFAVLQAGAVPVFADVDPDTFQIDPASIAARITPLTRAVIPVALYGLSPDLDAIMKLAAAHDLVVIEDDAETMLSKYKGRYVGTIGHMSSFSFQSSKHITSGEGGMVLCNDDELAVKIRRFNSLGYAGVDAKKAKISRDDIQDPEYSRHVTHGYNYRIPELCAAVALGQFERADELVQRRIDVAELFASVVDEAPWLKKQCTPADCVNSYWTFAVRMTHPEVSWREFRGKFRELGGDGVYAAWKLTYLEPLFANGCPVQLPQYTGKYQSFGPGLCPNAELVQKQMLQFKTNYWDWSRAEQQAEVLAKTMRHFA